MAKWSLLPFERLLREPVRNGIYKQKQFHGRGCKIVNMGELFGHPRLRAVSMKRVELNASERQRFLLAEGDLIFARRSLTAEGAGKCSIVLELDDDTTFESSIIRARPNPSKASSLFLYYFFNSPVGLHRLDTIRRQVAVAGITGTDLSKLEIPVPEIEEQQNIASILGAFDDKIDLNHRMNNTLEVMAQAIFKDWFVDFGPTRAKMEGRAPYLAPAFWSLFPERLDDGGKPEGWQYPTLADVTKRITKGTTATSHEIASAPSPDMKINFVRVNALTDDGAVLWEKLEHIPETVHLGSLKRSVLQEDDILYSIAGTIGRVMLVDRTLLPANTNQALAIIRPDTERVPSRFLKMVIRQNEFKDALHANIVHAVQANLSLSMISAARFVLPPSAVLVSLFAPIEALIRKIEGNNRESLVLASTRDLLLPKLMSGEVRMNGDEKMMEAVA